MEGQRKKKVDTMASPETFALVGKGADGQVDGNVQISHIFVAFAAPGILFQHREKRLRVVSDTIIYPRFEN